MRGRWPAECRKVPLSSRLMGRYQQQVALKQQCHQQRSEARGRQGRVHCDAQRAGILARCRRRPRMSRHLRGRTWKPLAVNMGGLRDTRNTNQQRAEHRSDTQPERPRSSAKFAMGYPLHATSSMTRFFNERTQLVAKLRILSHYVSNMPSFSPLARASPPGQSQTGLLPLQHQPLRRSGRQGPC